MAKSSPKSEPPPSSRPLARPSEGMMLGYRILKLAGFAIGFPAALVTGMALVGAITDSGYARVIGAGLVMLAVPLFVADRLLPEHDPTRARGLVSDVCAVTWTLVVFLAAGLANGSTRALYVREGDRLSTAGYGTVATLAYTLAWVKVEATAAPPAVTSASGSAAASSASAPPLDASVAVEPAEAGVIDASAPRPKPEVKAGEKSPADIFKEASPAVVTISVHGRAGDGGGTGFLLDREGTVATNHHVIEGAVQVRVKFINGATYQDVELLEDASAIDLALLKLDLGKPLEGGAKPDVRPIALGDSDGVVVGERAVSIGNPLGLEHTLTDGLISSRRLYEGRQWIQFSAPISPGNSGGPLFNMREEVVGITTATVTGFGRAQNLNLAVPVNELKKLIKPSYPGRRKIGDGTGPSHW